MGQFLESLEEMPPQDMAERILEFDLSFVPGARDDMTVLNCAGVETVILHMQCKNSGRIRLCNKNKEPPCVWGRIWV